MIEFVVGFIGLAIVTLAAWWTDRVKKHYRGKDYYDG